MTAPEPAPTGGRRAAEDRPVRRVALAGGVALVLLAVAAVASGGEVVSDSEGITLPRLRWLVAVGFLVMLAIGLFALGFILVQKRERRPPSATRQLRVLLVAAALVLLLLVLAGRGRGDGGAESPAGEPPPSEAPAAPASDLGSDTVWRDVAILLALVLVGAGAAVAAAGRRAAGAAAGGGDDAREAAVLSDVLDEAVAALRAEADPRRAVIAAYAHVERSLWYHRLPRRPSEAPIEYLGRLLEHLDASGPAIRRLTGLFERAMFSTHAVDRAMQDEAVDAVVAVRDDLRAQARRGDR